jgi:general secretion pathway protein N
VLRGGSDVGHTLSMLERGLRLSGSGHWVGHAPAVQGEASAAPGLQGVLANLLNILGRRQGDWAILSFS